jgi:hypothetical protein
MQEFSAVDLREEDTGAFLEKLVMLRGNPMVSPMPCRCIVEFV